MQNTERRLRTLMKDPDSMTIRSHFLVIRDGKTGGTEYNVCGIVDGRNSFGGYTGGTRFASRSVSYAQPATFDTYSVEIENETEKAQATRVRKLSPFESVYWNDYCVDATHAPLKPQK